LIDWSDNLTGSYERAREQSKPVMVDVWAVWCEPCKEMEETTFAEASVVALAREHLIPLKVNADIRGTFIKRYAIDAYPTLLFLDGEGRELTRREGLVTAADLVPLAERVHDGYAAYLEASNGPDSGNSAQVLREYLVSLGNTDSAVERVRSMFRSAHWTAPEEIVAIHLELGLALLESGSYKKAAKILSELADSAATPPAFRGVALRWLVKTEQKRGRDAEATAALEKLQAEFPELAARLP
jgi:thioredoxin-like negative regulator of GroEL